MTITTDVKVDATSVVKALSRISDNAPKVLIRGINDAAFILRKAWLSLITSNIDRPVNFTKQVFVDKAQENKLEALVFIPDIQSEYLKFMVEGGTRKGGDYGTYPDQILAPVGVKLNKQGNFPGGGPKRYLGAIASGALGEDVFIGSPNEFNNERGNGKRAVYEIQKDGRLKLMAVFVEMEKYKKTLPLYDEAEKISDTVVDAISKQIDELLR